MNVSSLKLPTTLSVGISFYRNNMFSTDLIKAFEAAHPDVTIKFVPNCNIYTHEQHVNEQSMDIDLKQAKSADVLAVSEFNISATLMRTGYFLDLTTLIRDDPFIDDYYPIIRRSFQWDGGFWALPYAMNLVGLTYDPAAFDRHGLSYPNADWTLADLETILKTFAPALSPYQKRGKLHSSFENYLLISLLGTSVVDASVLPNIPKFNTPAIAQLLEKWTAIEEKGWVDDGLADHEAAISLGILNQEANLEKNRVWSLLPGGRAGLNLSAILISAGTQQPELAYEFAKFLTTQKFESQYPVRQGLLTNYNASEVHTIEQILKVAISAADMRFVAYLNNVSIDKHVWKDTIESALERIQQQAVEGLATAETRRNTTFVVEYEQEKSTAVPIGKLALKVGMAYQRPLPHEEQWNQMVEQFVSLDPEIAAVDIDNYEVTAEDHDCLFMHYNAVPYAEPDEFLPLDSFMAADPSFNASDIVGGTLAAFQRNGQTLGLPIVIFPEIIRYETNIFNKAHIPEPSNGWTIEQFVDTLEKLKASEILMQNHAPFNPLRLVLHGSYLLPLISAFGGLPIDFRVSPLGLNFTDSGSVTAIRAVLDLAKHGLIQYDLALVQENSASFTMMTNGWALLPMALSQILVHNPHAHLLGENYKTVTFPEGKFKPVIYSVGGGYIRKNAKHPEAAYRWLTTLAKHPELFDGMPARRSLFATTESDPNFRATYENLDRILLDPDSLKFDNDSYAIQLVERTLFRAFDRYVLEDADLEEVLKQAQERAIHLIECLNGLARPAKSDFEAHGRYRQAALDCYKMVDPAYKSYY